MTLFPCAVDCLLVALIYFTQWFVSLNPTPLSCPSLFPPPNWQPLSPLFSISVRLFPFVMYIYFIFRFHIWGTQSFSLSLWLISTSIILSRSIHIVAKAEFFKNLWVISHCVCVYIYTHFLLSWRRKWQSSPVFFPGKFHGQKDPGRLLSVGLQKSWSWLSN